MMKQKFGTMGLCLALSLSSVGLVACSGADKKGDKLVTQQVVIPEQFKLIPADSPYIMADMQPFPYDKVGVNFFTAYAPFLTQLRQQMQRDYQDVPPEMLNAETRAMMAVLDELEGNFSLEGLKKLGVDLRAPMSLYGLGLWPVLRVSLSDGKAFEAMLARVEAKAGQALPRVKAHGVEFRQLSDADVALPIIIQDNALIVGLTSTQYYDTYMSLALGKTKPAKSLYEDNRLLAMQRELGVKPYISGLLNLESLVAGLLGLGAADSALAKSLVGLPDLPPDLPAECKAELAALTKHSPRLLFGYRDINDKELKATFVADSGTDLPARLAETRGVIPGLGTDLHQNAMGWFGVGVNLKNMASFLTRQAELQRATPFQCAELQDMDRIADQVAQAASGLPVYVQAIQGVSVIVKDLDLDLQNRQINTMDVALMVKTTDPQGLFQIIKATAPLPELQAVSLSPDGKPVPMDLPSMIAMSLPNVPQPYLIMTQDGLALAFGQGMADRVAQSMKVDARNTPLVALSYDMRAILRLIDRNIPQENISDDERMIYEAMFNAYSAFGPSVFSFDAAPKRFILDSSMVLLKGKGAGK